MSQAHSWDTSPPDSGAFSRLSSRFLFPFMSPTHIPRHSQASVTLLWGLPSYPWEQPLIIKNKVGDGATLRLVLHHLPEVPGGAEPQFPTCCPLTCMHCLPSLPHFPHLLWFPGITLQINSMPLNPGSGLFPARASNRDRGQQLRGCEYLGCQERLVPNGPLSQQP